MPQIGEIKRGQDIGHKTMHKLIWHACQRCGKERWVQFVRGKARWVYCRICAQTYNRYSPSGDSHYNWKGGITNSKDGYLLVTIQKSNPFSPMVRKRTANSLGRSNQVLQHRLIMANHLGRCLETWEHVHHLNGIRTDNRKENLALTDSRKHEKHTLNHLLMARIRELELKFIDKT